MSLHPSFSGSSFGSWSGAATPSAHPQAFKTAIEHLAQPVSILRKDERLFAVNGGHIAFGQPGEFEVVGHAPALHPSSLGDVTFRRHHHVQFAYVVGEMANGIASEELVEAAAKAGLLGIFGAAGLSFERVKQAVERLRTSLQGKPWGINLIHSPDNVKLEDQLSRYFAEAAVPLVSASAFLDLTLPLVRYRLTGISRDADGQIKVPRRLMAKVSRTEVARKFLSPAPADMVEKLIAQGELPAEALALSRNVPMADDVTAEADSGGHTDNRPLVLLLPALQALRDELCKTFRYAAQPRVGAGGGIATPASATAAFSMGAAYIVTGSINQATVEAATSDEVRAMLGEASSTDVTMAPAADMFEMGVKVQVLSRGTLFAQRATKLYEWYRTFDSVSTLTPAIKKELEEKYFRQSIDSAWRSVEQYFTSKDSSQLERARVEPKHQLALLFRSYLGQASRWANAGVADRKLDYQVWCGPAMGALNAWLKGSGLEPASARTAGLLAHNIMVGAAVLTRVSMLRAQGVQLPSGVDSVTPRSADELVASLSAPAILTSKAKASTPAERRPKDEPIAIVGMGSLFPKAENITAFWRLLRNGVDATQGVPPSHWSIADYYDVNPKAPDKTYVRRGAFLDATPFDPTAFGIPPSILEATDTAQLLGLWVAKQALEDARLGDNVTWNRDKASVILGVTGTQELVIELGARLGHPRWRRALVEAGVDEATTNDVVERISNSYVSWQENSFPGLLGNVVAGRIANRLDFGGTNCVIDAACASSLGAVHLAMLELRSGNSDVVLSGGVDCLNDIFMHMCFSKTPALSPTEDVRPFSDKADGTLLGEGLGMLVLKRLSDAERDGDRIYATILSIGTSSDGRAKSIYAPLPQGQAKALRRAYEQAQVRPRDIELLEAHGTGTKAGDAAEFEALSKVYAETSSDLGWCTLGSIKSQIGHTKAAAGAAGLMKAALALYHRVLPPTLKVETPNPAMKLELSPFSISGLARPWLKRSQNPRRAAVSSFGFGGSNFHAVLEESQVIDNEVSWDGSVTLLPFSASSASALIDSVNAFLREPQQSTARSQTLLRRRFKSSDNHRLVVVLSAGQGIEPALKAASQRIGSAINSPFSTLDGTHYGVGPAEGKVAFLFPGQGSQHVNMLREWCCVFPECKALLEQFGDVADTVFPTPSFIDSAAAAQSQKLTQTNNAQPAIGLLSVAALRVLQRFGVTADCVSGHSFGELTALHAAGVLSLTDFVKAARERGRLMSGDGSDRGTMLAVLAPLNEIEQMLDESNLDVVLANRNAPNQGVLSGSRVAIDATENTCKKRGMKTVRLSVGAAFHSSLVAGAAKDFSLSLQSISLSAPQMPVIGNSKGEQYPQDLETIRQLLANQLAVPVRFDDTIEKLYALGARTFVEVGPKNTLSGLVKANLGSRPHFAVAVDAGHRNGALFDLAQLLAHLAARGHSVRLDAWESSSANEREAQEPAKAVPRMSVPLTGANYRQPYTPKAPKPIRRAEVTTPSAPLEPAPQTAIAAPLLALQKMQAEAARLHQLFLENQLSFQQQIQQLAAGGPVVQRPSISAVTPRLAPPAIAPPLPVVPTVPTMTTAAPPAVSSTLDTGQIVLTVVSTLTGYPRETLSLSMDLEADLGIDSIKRVEILSTLSKQIPSAPAVNPEKLGALRTLQDIVNFVGVATTPMSAPVSASAPAPAKIESDVSATVIAVVSDLTGYPSSTLSLGMDLEADLGIDSIKRVEILSTLSKKIAGAPNVNPEKLGSLRTLADIVQFVAGEPNGHQNGTNKAEPLQTPNRTQTPDTRSIVLSVVASLTGYPVDTLEGHMDLEADLGIDSIKRVEILSTLSRQIAGAPNVNPEKLGSLRTLDNVIAFVSSEANGSHGTAPNGTLKAVAVNQATAVSPERVEYLAVVPTALSAARATQSLRGHYLISAQSSAFAEHVKDALRAHGATASLLSESPFDGPLAGLLLLSDDASVLGEETQRALVSALAFARSHSARLHVAQNHVFAVARGDGAFGLLNVALTNPVARGLGGLVKSLRHEWPTVKCRSLDIAQSIDDAEAAQLLVTELMAEGPSEVGYTLAGRVGLELAVDETQTSATELKPGEVLVVTGGARGVTALCVEALAQRKSLKLLLLGRTPLNDEPEFLRTAVDEATIKQLLLSHATGPRPTPKMLGAQCRAVIAAREVRATLRRMAERGIEARYEAVDVRDEGSLSAVLSKARQQLGVLTGIVHGAGVLRDRRIEDKSDDDFEQVLGTKIGGLLPLLRATAHDQLKLMALFTSVSGRFGRKGQTDYAVANEALVGVALNESARRSGARVVALDFGPWNGGMVTEALKREFAKEGAALIDQQLGSIAFCDAVLRRNTAVEVVIAAGMRKSDEPRHSRLMAVHLLDSRWPILSDHQLAQKPVLPLALTLEWFAQAAQKLQPHGTRVSLEDVHVLRGVNIERTAVASVWNDADNNLELRNGQGQVCVRAKLRFETEADVEPQTLERLPSFATALQTVYREQLFHGPRLEAISAIEGISETGMRVALKGSPFVSELVPSQLAPFLVDPLVVDGVFQALIVWCRNQKGAPSLPQRIKRLRVYRPFSGGEFTASIRIIEHDGATVTANIEVLNAARVVVAQFEGYVCTVSPTLELAFERGSSASLPPTRAAS